MEKIDRKKLFIAIAITTTTTAAAAATTTTIIYFNRRIVNVPTHLDNFIFARSTGVGVIILFSKRLLGVFHAKHLLQKLCFVFERSRCLVRELVLDAERGVLVPFYFVPSPRVVVVLIPPPNHLRVACFLRPQPFFQRHVVVHEEDGDVLLRSEPAGRRFHDFFVPDVVDVLEDALPQEVDVVARVPVGCVRLFRVVQPVQDGVCVRC